MTIPINKLPVLAGALGLSLISTAEAGIIGVSPADFHANAGLITFSEYTSGTPNPTYAPADYGGGAGAPSVTFGGYFLGQSLSLTPDVDCPGAAGTACVAGSPSGPLALDPSSPETFITGDADNPISPVLSGTPLFAGPIAVLFDTDQAGVGFDAGFFDAVASTAITAFARDGSLLGSVINTLTDIEFLGLVTDDGSAKIAGVMLDLVGSEPEGFAIDNLRFALPGQVEVPGTVPEPATLGLMAMGLAGWSAVRRKRPN